MAGTTLVGAGVAVPLGHQESLILAATEFDRMAAVAPGAVRARCRTPASVRRAVRPKNDPPFDAERWRYGYLVDTIFTRDTWMHRLDISRATGRPMELTAGHDGRLVADV